MGSLDGRDPIIGRRNDRENRESREAATVDHCDDINHTKRSPQVQPVRVTACVTVLYELAKPNRAAASSKLGRAWS
jgi:hypothetical protein